MLQIENASIAYGNDILFSGFNLQLERGEIASISGPSGCGKSSLLIYSVKRRTHRLERHSAG